VIVQLFEVTARTSVHPDERIVVNVNNHATWSLSRERALDLASRLVHEVAGSSTVRAPAGTLAAIDAIDAMISDLERCP
jgi:hypothetical protein